MGKKWLRSGIGKPVITPKIESVNRQLKLAVEHSYLEKESDELDYDKYIYNITKSRKCLIFANYCTQKESIVSFLHQIARTEGFTDIYYVPHSSISDG
jgi:ATP-dependent Lhr-like helicase